MEEDRIIVNGEVPPPEVVEKVIAQMEGVHKKNLILNCLYLLIGCLLWAIQLALVYYKVLNVEVVGAAILGAVFGIIIGHLIARLAGEIYEYNDAREGLVKLLELSRKMKDNNEPDVFENNNKTEE